jgi:hypothetical protein
MIWYLITKFSMINFQIFYHVIKKDLIFRSAMTRNYPFQWVDVPQDELVRAMRKPLRDYVRSVPGAFPKLARLLTTFQFVNE